MNQTKKHKPFLFASLAVTLSTLFYLSMASQYYTLKIAKRGSLARQGAKSGQSKINSNKQKCFVSFLLISATICGLTCACIMWDIKWFSYERTYRQSYGRVLDIICLKIN